MSPSTPSAFNETRLRVRYAETDQMGIVYHSNHLIWFEVGRVELLRQLGFSYRDMEREDGRFIAVAEVTCRYRAPAYYDEEVLVRTRLKTVRESVVVFSTNWYAPTAGLYWRKARPRTSSPIRI